MLFEAYFQYQAVTQAGQAAWKRFAPLRTPDDKGGGKGKSSVDSSKHGSKGHN